MAKFEIWSKKYEASLSSSNEVLPELPQIPSEEMPDDEVVVPGDDFVVEEEIPEFIPEEGGEENGDENGNENGEEGGEDIVEEDQE